MSFVPKEATTASPIQSQVNSFGTRFIREMARGGVDNFFVSPFGAYTVMAMLGAGARGDTAQEIDSVLGREALGYEDFMAELGRETKTDWDLGELKVSNQGWHKPGESLANNFRDRLSLLNTAIESLDFSDRDRAAQVMNDWASDATEGRIPQIITPDAIDPEVLVIVLALSLIHI